MILWVMIIVIVNECLEVTDLDLFLASLTLNKRVQLEEHTIAKVHWRARGAKLTCVPLRIKIVSMALKKFLNYLIAFQLVVSDPEDLESLLSGHKTTFNAKTFFSNLFATFVTKLFHRGLIIFLMKILENFLHSFLFGQWSNLAGALLHVR